MATVSGISIHPSSTTLGAVGWGLEPQLPSYNNATTQTKKTLYIYTRGQFTVGSSPAAQMQKSEALRDANSRLKSPSPKGLELRVYVFSEQCWWFSRRTLRKYTHRLTEHKESTWTEHDSEQDMVDVGCCVVSHVRWNAPLGLRVWGGRSENISKIYLSCIRNELMESRPGSHGGCYDTVTQSKAPSPSKSFTRNEDRGKWWESHWKCTRMRGFSAHSLSLISQLNTFIIPIKS